MSAPLATDYANASYTSIIAKSRKDIVVESHRATGELAPVEITHFLSAVTWTDSVDAPWGDATLTVQTSLRATMNPALEQLPVAGDWIVIRLGDGQPAEWFGRVVSPSTGYATDANGVAMGRDGTIHAENWFATLRREQVLVATGMTSAVGTVFGKYDWRALFQAVAAGFADGIGGSLAAMVKWIAQLPLPRSLGGKTTDTLTALRSMNFEEFKSYRVQNADASQAGVITRGTLAQAVTVAYDQLSTALSCGIPACQRTGAPRREVETIPATGLPAVQTLWGRPGGSALDFITGTYSADPMLMEMFPSLEDFSGGSFVPSAFTSLDGVPASLTSGGLGRATGVNAVAPKIAPTAQGVLSPVGTASSALGRNPVLLYRMKPWRVQSLAVYAANIGYTLPADPTIFQGATWNAARAVDVSADDVLSLSMASSFDDAYTAITVGLPMDPDSPVRFFQRAGLPVTSNATLLTYGLHLYSITWPFFRLDDIPGAGTFSAAALRAARQKIRDETLTAESSATDVALTSVLAYLRSVALLGFQFLFNADRFLSGTCQLATLRPDVRHGEPVTVGTPDGGTITGYATSVTHTIAVQPDGSEQHTTSFDYVRGLPDYLEASRAATGATAIQLLDAVTNAAKRAQNPTGLRP